MLCPEQTQQPYALYSAEERVRRDRSIWTLVQGVLAPLQFLVFAVSVVLIVRFLLTGHGFELAAASVGLKTAVLYLIMVTGSIWEKDVFGVYLFAPAFFWEDVVSILVLVLHTAYLIAWYSEMIASTPLMWLAVAAYCSYLVNAAQFLLKFRAARLATQTQTIPHKAATA